MTTPSVNLENYLRFLSAIMKERWDNRNNPDFEGRDELSDSADHAWLEMTDEEHLIANLYLKLHCRKTDADGVRTAPPEYSTELVLATMRQFEQTKNPTAV